MCIKIPSTRSLHIIIFKRPEGPTEAVAGIVYSSNHGHISGMGHDPEFWKVKVHSLRNFVDLWI